MDYQPNQKHNKEIYQYIHLHLFYYKLFFENLVRVGGMAMAFQNHNGS